MPESFSFLERRSQSRVQVKVPIQYQLVENKKELEMIRGRHALAKDLSVNGMFMKTDKPVKTGDILRLDISVSNPKMKRFFAFAEVVRITAKGAGVRLLLMPEEDRSGLKEYLTQVSNH
jgi:c-di-GMP-binding flagellar brake protein YcgR